MNKRFFISLVLFGTLLPVFMAAHATQIDIVDPSGDAFGAKVVTLPNGNFVVVDDGGVGAVHLYSSQGVRISTLSGQSVGDLAGVRIIVLPGGNFLVAAYEWDNGPNADAGAVTWVNGTTGISGVISAANSLTGANTGDWVGLNVKTLANGNYVVVSPMWTRDVGGTLVSKAGAVTWARGDRGISGRVSAANSLVGSATDDGSYLGFSDPIIEVGGGNFIVANAGWKNGAAVFAGAVTWVDGRKGIVGPVSAINSLVGTHERDFVGIAATVLSDGNYVVQSGEWSDASIAHVGAVTWCSGNAATVGTVSSANSLTGKSANDYVGLRVAALSNGNYLVISDAWNNAATGATAAGAVTWVPGGAPFSGTVSAGNSLVGSTADDHVGSGGFRPLSNGNVLIVSPAWDGGAVDVGAVTWLDADGRDATGHSILTGAVVSDSNSLVASAANDSVGGVFALNNGNYVVSCPSCDLFGKANVGAVVWGDGAHGTSGVISGSNALHGTTADDYVGENVVPLANGNYVVVSRLFDNVGFAVNTANAGAVTWVNGTTGAPADGTNVVSFFNSLLGSTVDDQVGRVGVYALANGNYVVASDEWDDGSIVNAGAVTWGDGTTGVRGYVDSSNSLVGTSSNDFIGYNGAVTPLPNGNYVVVSIKWDEPSIPYIVDAGAVVWANGTTGVVGPITFGNALVPLSAGSQAWVGQILKLLPNGDYVVQSPHFDNCFGGSCITDAGEITLGSGSSGTVGPIGPDNSFIGATYDGGSTMVWDYNRRTGQLVIGQPQSNTVSIFGDGSLFKDDFED